MTSIYFVRHGESTANRDAVCAGHTDVDLTDLGVRQAYRAGQELLASQVKIEVIVSSPLKRARQTADSIAKQINYKIENIIETPLAMERYRGRFEGMLSSAQDGATEADFARMGAESMEDMVKRAQSLLAYIKALNAQSVLVVSHNHFGKVFVSICRGESSYTTAEKIPNAHIFKI